MSEKKTLSWETLSKYLSNRTVLERFLTEFLGREIHLKERVWQSHLFDPLFQEDIVAVDKNDEIYAIVIQRNQFDYWWKQIEYIGASHCFEHDTFGDRIGCKRYVTVVAICNFDPFAQGRYYYHLGVGVGDRDGETVCISGLESHVQYHICCVHPDISEDAPDRIQQFLDVLNGKRDESPELLDEVLICWDWRDVARASLREKIADVYWAEMQHKRERGNELENEIFIVEVIDEIGERQVEELVKETVDILNHIELLNIPDSGRAAYFKKMNLSDKMYRKILLEEEIKETDFYEWLQENCMSRYSRNKCEYYIRKSEKKEDDEEGND